MTGGLVGELMGSGLLRTWGWVWIHALWQAGFVAVGLLVALRLLPRSAVRLRPAAPVLALGLTVALVAATAWTLHGDWRAHVRCWEVSRPHSVAAGSSCAAHGVPVAADAPGPASTKATGVLPWLPVALQTGSGIERVAATRLTPFTSLLALLWLGGSLAGTAALLLGLLTLRRVVAKAARIEDPRLLGRLRALGKRIGRPAGVELRESGRVDTPCVAGVHRPVVLLPSGLTTTASDDDLDAVFSHELAHVARRDPLFGVLEAAVRALLPLNPGLAWITSMARTEREAACDRIASGVAGVTGARYARTLLLLEGLRSSSRRLGLVTALAGEGELLERVRRLRAAHVPERKPWAAPATVVTGVAVVAVVLGLAVPLLSAGSWAVMQEDIRARSAAVPVSDPGA